MRPVRPRRRSSPQQGPGGRDYKSTEVVKRAVGTASSGTFVFHGNDAPAKPRPVVIFLHSWGAVDPGLYGGWIDHLARKGHLVLFPRFQDVNRSRPADASNLAEDLIQSALAALAEDANAKPDRERVAFIGHSAGVPIAFNLAAGTESGKVPAPKLVFGLMPGGIASNEKERGILLRDLSTIAPSTLLITMSGDRDHLPSDRAARLLMQQASAVPSNRKLFMRAVFGRSRLSRHDRGAGVPRLAEGRLRCHRHQAAAGSAARSQAAQHLALERRHGAHRAADLLTQALGNNGTDTLDYLAFWKTFDIASEAAFAGKDAAALLRDPKFVDMGTWSDGWPVRRLSAQMPKVEGQENKPEPGPRRRLNMAPPETKQGSSDFLTKLRS